jgi:hypothetical protein
MAKKRNKEFLLHPLYYLHLEEKDYYTKNNFFISSRKLCKTIHYIQ